MATKTRLTKREVERLYNVAERLDNLRARFAEPGKDFALQTTGNGTIVSNLSAAIASIDIILQEYL